MISIEQLEFDKLLAMIQPSAAAMQPKCRVKHKVATASLEQFAVVLNRAVAEENVSFSTYSLMMAVHSHAKPASRIEISIQTGYSYFAVRNQEDRTPWFLRTRDEKNNVCLTLTPEAKTKLERISKRIARYV